MLFRSDGDDKAKLERVRKFYAPVKAVVEFPHPGPMEARSLAQLGQDAAGAFGRRCVRKERLRRQARREDVGVDLRIALPGPDHLEVEHAAAQVRGQHAVLETFHARQAVTVDLFEPAQVPGKRTRFLVDRVAAQVLEQVVVRVDPVERRVRGTGFVEVPQEVVDEVRQRFGNGHGSLAQRCGRGPRAEPRTQGSAIFQWYNNVSH